MGAGPQRTRPLPDPLQQPTRRWETRRTGWAGLKQQAWLPALPCHWKSSPSRSPDHAGRLSPRCGAQTPPHGTSTCKTPLLWEPLSPGSSAPSTGCSPGSKQTSEGAISSFPLTASPPWSQETHVPSALGIRLCPFSLPPSMARCPPGALQPSAPKHRHPPGRILVPPAQALPEARQDMQRGRLLPQPRSQKHVFGIRKDDFLDCSCPACSWLQAGMTGTCLRVEQLNPSKLAAAVSPHLGNASSSQPTPFTGRQAAGFGPSPAMYWGTVNTTTCTPCWQHFIPALQITRQIMPKKPSSHAGSTSCCG